MRARVMASLVQATMNSDIRSNSLTPRAPERKQAPPTAPRVVLNVGGEIYETFEDTLKRFPNTLLGTRKSRAPFYREDSKQYFFDRNRACFSYILYFYQSNGMLRCPLDINPTIFEEECIFFQMPKDSIDVMKEGRGIVATLKKQRNTSTRRLSTTTRLRQRIYDVMENPETSIAARTFTFISAAVIFLSIIAAVLETVPSLNPDGDHDDDHSSHSKGGIGDNFWLTMEFVLNLYFLVELALRFICAPSQLKFYTDLMNWIDSIAILPYFIMMIATPDEVLSLGYLRILRLVRILRLFRLHKLYSLKLQVISAVIRSGIDDLKILLVCTFISVCVAGSALYYIEQIGPNSTFTSIPVSGWWAVVTMSTSGYGDIIPMTALGRVLAAMYMIMGAMTVSLPALSIGSRLVQIYEDNMKCVEQNDFML